jgi:hypothetical protein
MNINNWEEGWGIGAIVRIKDNVAWSHSLRINRGEIVKDNCAHDFEIKVVDGKHYFVDKEELELIEGI